MLKLSWILLVKSSPSASIYAEKNTYIELLISTSGDDVSGVQEHIKKLTRYFYKLRKLDLDLGEDFPVWKIIHTLPSQFSSLCSCYNVEGKNWTLGEMTDIVTREEEEMKRQKSTTEKVGKHARKSRLAPKREGFKGKCNFCNLVRHKKVNCWKFKPRLAKKGTLQLVIYF